MRKLLKLFSLILFGVICAAVFFEIGLRIMEARGALPNRMPADIFAAHSIGWALEPDTKSMVFSPYGVINIESNREGFRDRNYPVERTNRPRIAVLGDSFTLALETPQEETFHVQLESRLDAEVISFGVSGYELAQHTLVYREVVQNYHPDIVLLMLYIGNDLVGNETWSNLPVYHLDRQGDLVLNNFPYQGEFNLPLVISQRSSFWMRHSRLIFLLGTLLVNKSPSGNGDYCDYWQVADYPQPTEAEWQLSEALLLKLRMMVAENGADLRVAIIPTEHQIEPSEAAEYVERCGDPPPNAQERLVKFLEANDFVYLDLLPVLSLARREQGTRLYINSEDTHLTLEGHDVVAEALAEWLRENQ